MHFDVALLLFILSLGAFVVPILAPRLQVPEAVGHIFFGIGVALVYPDLLGSLDSSHGHRETEQVLHLLAELGFILLMFGAGMEINFAAIERGGKSGVIRGLLVAIGVIVLSAGLVAQWGLGPFYVVVLSATSIGLGVVVLRETGLANKPVGQTVLLVGAIGEFFTLVAMTVYNVYKNVGGLKLELLLEVGKLSLLLVVGALFLRFLKAWSWWHPDFFQRVFAEHDHSEFGVRAAVTACLAFVALAVFLKIDPILGAFIAGAVARMVFRDVNVLETKMSALASGFFIPIFFIGVGMTFEFSQLSVEGFKTALFLGGLMVLARVVPCALLVTDRNLGPREAFGVSLLLAAPLTLLVAIAKLGEKIGVIDEKEGSALVLLAILLSIVTPVIFRILFRRPGLSVAHH
ncbi:MAG: cation:proton antiporter [Myxococcota bacterium]|nr:cation:proton antiporter [Myxococcota bacterium]